MVYLKFIWEAKEKKEVMEDMLKYKCRLNLNFIIYSYK